MKRTRLISTCVWLFAGLFLLATLPNSHAQLFDNGSVHGDYALSLSGTFSSALPPFTGPVENVGFTQVGLFRFDGNGRVEGEYTFVVQTPLLGAAFQYTAAGTYSVAANGRMIIRTEDSIGGVKANAITYQCVIVQRHRLAQCVFTEVISFQQGPNPVLLPTAGSGKLERQRFTLAP